MVRIKVPGSVYRRGNGRWAAQSPEIYDRSKQEWRRISLGTYERSFFAFTFWTAIPDAESEICSQ